MDDSKPTKNPGGRPRTDVSKVTRPFALSLRPQAIADLAAIRSATGERAGEVVGRLLADEWKRIARRGEKPDMTFAEFADRVHERIPDGIAFTVLGRDARFVDERHGIEFAVTSHDGRSAFAVGRSTIDPTRRLSPTRAYVIGESAISEIVGYVENGMNNPTLRLSNRDTLIALTDRIRAIGLMENLITGEATIVENFAVLNSHNEMTIARSASVRWNINERFHARGLMREDGAVSVEFIDRDGERDYVPHVVPYLVTEEGIAQVASDVAHWVVAGIAPQHEPTPRAT